MNTSPKKSEFYGKVALITGSSSGIGESIALAFSKQDASVSLTGRNEERLKNVAEECRKLGAGKVLTTLGDMTNENDIKKIVDNTVKQFGKLDILVNCAGIYKTDNIENGSLEKFDTMINTNLRSVYYITHLSIPFLISSKGCIINISSLSGLRPVPWSLTYCLSKSALNQFTKCIALELAPKQVRVNSVNPGATLTGIQERAGITGDKMEEFLNKCRKTYPLGRVGRPEDMANAVLFLASDKAGFITGVNLPVDGGKHDTMIQ